MEGKIITEQNLMAWKAWLIDEEKSGATVEKYLRYGRAFAVFADGAEVTKNMVREWKESLSGGYAPRTINAMLAGVNSLLNYLGMADCKVKNLKIQEEPYASEGEELSRQEYERLLAATSGQLRLIMETICSTGIRVSELRFFTVEAVENQEVRICNKGKHRTILIPGKLKKKLLHWANKNDIREGVIFRTKTGKPLDRRTIWARMKKLCGKAGVERSKVFPHNLRKLFARTFYRMQMDIAKLADVLGHSNINTTRIYIRTSGNDHRRILDSLCLVS